MTVRVEVAAPMLAWAMERSGRAQDELVSQFPKLPEWQEGERTPTIRQLESFARATRTPLGYRAWIDRANHDGTVFNITKVLEELRAGEDELSLWAQRRRDELFLAPDDAVIDSLRALSTWANSGRYEQTGVATFLQAADYYLVAHAHAHTMTVVTHEISGPA